MRSQYKTIKILLILIMIAGSLILPTGAAFGIVGNSVEPIASLVSVPGALARASSDIRVRRLKQMFNANQITPEDYFESIQSESASRDIEPEAQE
jgi:hypothetical protein